MRVIKASSNSAFEILVHKRAGGLILGTDALFSTHYEQLIALAAQHSTPVIYRTRETTVLGGLMSYGADFPDAWRQVGRYAGRILKGEKPADLPVQQSIKVELVINLKTARVLGLKVPANFFGACR